MTKVTFYQDSRSRFTGFEIVDHAGQADSGEDIVCAAVSALAITISNSMERFTDDPVRISQDAAEARISCSLPAEHSKEADLLIQTLALGLTEIEESYPDFLDVIFSEVE